MSCKFSGKGNLGNAPVLKHPIVDGQSSTMVELYVYFDRRVPVNDGFEDRGGFWLHVEYWSDERAEHIARLLNRGCRIRVEGTLVLNIWEGDSGPDSRLVLQAKDITLDLARVESVAYVPKPQANVKPAQPTEGSADSLAVEEEEPLVDQ